jgi:DNA replication and repair protein RecF
VYVSRLLLTNFRSYEFVDLSLSRGATCLLGANGQGKTNVVEAIDYLSRLESHRVAQEAPLVRAGCERAVIQAAVQKSGRTATLDVEIIPGKTNRGRINKAPLTRIRDLVGVVRTVLFAPDDLSLVKGDPSERRRFLDQVMVLRKPQLSGVRADYERVLRQRNTLLKSARGVRGSVETLDVWDEQLIRHGAEIVAERFSLVTALLPYLEAAYQKIAATSSRSRAQAEYRPSFEATPDTDIAEAMQKTLVFRRREELDRGLTLVGPHRDELLLSVQDHKLSLPVRGYASHGESWSFALALRLASYELLRHEGDDPILILDDVFAELDAQRRQHLAELVVDSEQVLVTAAVADDVPQQLTAQRLLVNAGNVGPLKEANNE